MARTKDGTGPEARRRATQADVARHAGVSPGIVSSVINARDYGSIRVSEATRARVWSSVRELGYVPNIAARNLARGANRLLGVFTYQPVFPLESRDFYHEFLIGIEEEAERAGYHLLLFTGSKDAERRRSIYSGGLNSLQLADGSVLVGSGESESEVARLAGEGYPFVFVGRRSVPGHELSFAAADYVGGTGAAVHALAERGHRRIALVRDCGSGEPVPGRRVGYRRAVDELGGRLDDAPVATLGGPAPEDPADAAAAAEWAFRRGITALVVERSLDAAEIRAAAERAGRRVPEDLSIVGLGVAPDLPNPLDLAELTIPRREMGQEAVRLLLRLLAEPGSGPHRTTLPCGFREGPTLGRAPA